MLVAWFLCILSFFLGYSINISFFIVNYCHLYFFITLFITDIFFNHIVKFIEIIKLNQFNNLDLIFLFTSIKTMASLNIFFKYYKKN
jgi:hypothetical protein